MVEISINLMFKVVILFVVLLVSFYFLFNVVRNLLNPGNQEEELNRMCNAYIGKYFCDVKACSDCVDKGQTCSDCDERLKSAVKDDTSLKDVCNKYNMDTKECHKRCCP